MDKHISILLCDYAIRLQIFPAILLSESYRISEDRSQSSIEGRFRWRLSRPRRTFASVRLRFTDLLGRVFFLAV